MFADVETADTFWRRFTGLMAKKHIPSGYALVFPKCSSVHGLFMRVPIDVAFLDEDWTVLNAEVLRPWHMAFGPKGTYATLECAEGELARLGIATGDRIRL